MPFDHFNIIAGFYDRAGKFVLAEPLIGLLALSPDCRLLDAGGGTGRIATTLRSLLRQVIVLDTSLGMLAHAKEKALTAVCAAVERLPFDSGSFERILMIDALHHVHNQRQTARALWDALATGGRIVVVEPDINKISVKAIALGEKVLLMRSHFLSGDKICSLFAGLGAKIEVSYDRNNVFIVVEKT
jgi:ubiquinone/menaquinone biosynthesis C-methylase UbiE